MVISDSHSFLFIHIPKTAGKSIAAALAPEGERKHALCLKGKKHESVEDFVKRNGRGVFQRYYSFCVVRHPFDRFMSHYAYLKMNPQDFPELSTVHSIEEYVEAIERGDQTIIRKRERVLPQHCYVKLGPTPIAVSRVIRFEDLSSSFYDLCDRLAVPRKRLPVLNQSPRRERRVSASVEDFVRRYYEVDFQLFNY